MATYYVRPTNGSDAAAGTSFATAWKTLQYAIDNVSAGDVVRLCAESTELTNAQIDWDGSSGTVSSWITFVGASGSDGSIDGSRYTVKAGASFPGSTPLCNSGEMDYVSLANIIFDAAAEVGGTDATYALYGSSATDVAMDNVRIIGCVFRNGTAGGCVGRGWDHWHLCGCEVYGNGGIGLGGNTNNRGSGWRIFGCSIHDNASHGIQITLYEATVAGCRIYANGGSGINVTASATYNVQIIGNTIFANDADGVTFTSATNMAVVFGNSFVDSGGYGVDDGNTGADMPYVLMMESNHYDGNVTNPTSAGATPPDISNYQSGDPKFTSETDGSEDFRPTAGSPLLAGLAFLDGDIGALGPIAGGGSVIHRRSVLMGDQSTKYL